MNHRKEDLSGIRKARYASFVLLFVGFAAMLVILVLLAGTNHAYIASVIIIAALVVIWWFVFRRLIYFEAGLNETYWKDVRAVNRRLRTFESAVRQIGDGVIIIANDGDHVFVNETIKNLFAAYDRDLDGEGYDEYAAGFSEKLERSAILAAAKDGAPPDIVNISGRDYKISYTALASEREPGQGAVAVVSDITDSTKTERMQIEFVSNVSHELKTPLASIKGCAETLMEMDKEEGKPNEEFLGIIVSEADRMDRLIKGLRYLDLSESQIDAEEIDLILLVKTAIKKVDISAKKKSQSVNQMFAQNLRVNVEIDRDKIEQVLLNILTNAINYTGEKGRIDVDIIPGQNCVQIVISDNGVGIPEEDLARVFERFYRVDKARSGNTGGTGLGLAISKQIVDAHGGSINIESNYGRGTTVTISLPLGKSRGTPGIL